MGESIASAFSKIQSLTHARLLLHYYLSLLLIISIHQDIILAPGSIPFVPPGITVDEKTVYTSDGALQLPFVPEWVAIVGSGYIGLEFSDVYTALGSEVTFIEALDNIMPTFDREIAKQAERLLIRDRPIDYRTGVFASEVTPGVPGEKPVTIKMIDAKTKEHVETLEVDACMVATGRVPNTANMGLENAGIATNRGFVAVDEKMRVMSSHDDDATVIPNVYCIGDANGKMMLAHAASAQGISAVENIVGRSHVVDHDAMYVGLFCVLFLFVCLFAVLIGWLVAGWWHSWR